MTTTSFRSRDRAVASICGTFAPLIVDGRDPWERALLDACTPLFSEDTRLQLVRLRREVRSDRETLPLDVWFDQSSAPPAPPRIHPVFRDAVRHPCVHLLLHSTANSVRMSDAYDVHAFQDSEIFQVVHPAGTRYLGGALLASDADGVAFLGVETAHRDLDDEDRRIMDMLSAVLGSALILRRRLERLRLEAMHSDPAASDGPLLPLPDGRGTGARYRPTPRQQQVLALLADGLTSSQMGRRLGISERTVRKHLEEIYARAGVPSRAAAVAWWVRRDP